MHASSSSQAATGPRRNDIRRCGPSSTGPTTCSTNSQQRAFANSRCSPVGGRSAPPIPCARTEAGRSTSTIALTRALVDKSLVETIQIDDAATRYDMLETIRAYAADTLAGDGGEAVDAARAAHFRHFAAFAEQAAAQLTQPDQIAWFDRLDARRGQPARRRRLRRPTRSRCGAPPRRRRSIITGAAAGTQRR